MIERLIFTALQNALAEMAASRRKLTRLFHNIGISNAEIASIWTYFSTHPPMLVHNYPRVDEATFPLFAIILNEEKESTKFLNDEGGIITDEDLETLMDPTLEQGVIRTSIYQFEYSILILTQQPDLTLYYYQIAKWALTRSRQFFKANGLLDTYFSGSDLAPDARYLPEYLFVRRLNFQGLVENPIYEENATGIIRSVGGIFTDDSSPEARSVNASVEPIFVHPGEVGVPQPDLEDNDRDFDDPPSGQ